MFTHCLVYQGKPLPTRIERIPTFRKSLSLTCQYAFALPHAPGLYQVRGDHPVHPGNLYSPVLEKPVR
jgi:hypothetical protein